MTWSTPALSSSARAPATLPEEVLVLADQHQPAHYLRAAPGHQQGGLDDAGAW
jgi:hypothetical protein